MTMFRFRDDRITPDMSGHVLPCPFGAHPVGTDKGHTPLGVSLVRPWRTRNGPTGYVLAAAGFSLRTDGEVGERVGRQEGRLGACPGPALAPADKTGQGRTCPRVSPAGLHGGRP